MAKPLAGKKILVTRSKNQASPFNDKLRGLGAIPLVAPLLNFKPVITNGNKELFTKLHEFTWVFFTSANGVKFFFELLDEWKMEHTTLDTLKIGVIGKKTHNTLLTYGYQADFEPSHFAGIEMTQEFLDRYTNTGKLLLICGKRSRDDIPDALLKHHVFFRKAAIYDTLINVEAKSNLIHYIMEQPPDAFTFTSPSTVDAFLTLTNDYPDMISKIKSTGLCICIGTTTKQKAMAEGFRHILVPDEFTTDGMIVELVNYFSRKGQDK